MEIVHLLILLPAALLYGFAIRSYTLFRGIALTATVLAGLCTLPGGGIWKLLGLFIAWDLGLILLAFLFLLIFTGVVDRSQPQEEDDPLYRRVMHLYIDALMDIMRVRLETTGLEKTPKDGRFLLVCNHLFIADPGIVLHCFRKSQLAFITKKENDQLPIINSFMHKILCQNLDREDDRQALKVILKCIQLLKEDKVSVCAFPEGYTSRDGLLHHFRSGVFKIAQKANVPIVVCTIQGTRPLIHNWLHFRSTPIALHLLDVIPPEALRGKTTVEISNQVYEMMIADLGGDKRIPQEV